MSLAIERTKSSRPPQHLSRHHLTKISWHHLTNMIYTGAARGLIARPAQFTRKGAVNPPLGVSDKTRVLRGHDYRYGESLGDFLIAMDGRDRSAARGSEGGRRGAVTGGITRQANEMGRIRDGRDSPWTERAPGQVNLDDCSRRDSDGLSPTSSPPGRSSTSVGGGVSSFEASANWPRAPGAVIGTSGRQAVREHLN